MMIVVVKSYSKLPNGNGEHEAAKRTEGTLNRIVDDWLNETKRPAVEGIYGPIEDWDTSLVSDMSTLFRDKSSFNADLSKWETGEVTNMGSSKCTLLGVVFFSKQE